MKACYLLLVLILLLFFIVPVSAAPYFQAQLPSGCVHPGDTISAIVSYEEDQDPSNWGDWEFAFDWSGMDFVDYDGVCEFMYVESDYMWCYGADFGGTGILTLKVKDDVREGTILPVSVDGWYWGDWDPRFFTRTSRLTVCPNTQHPVPEFPSPVLPVVFISGFIGALLYIQRTKEH